MKLFSVQMNRIFSRFWGTFALFLASLSVLMALNRNEAPAINDATPATDILAQSERTGMTLYELLEAGGWVMLCIGLLSIMAVALVIYFFVTSERAENDSLI